MTFSVSEFVDGYFKVIIDCLVGKSIQKINKKNATELTLPAVRCRFLQPRIKNVVICFRLRSVTEIYFDCLLFFADLQS